MQSMVDRSVSGVSVQSWCLSGSFWRRQLRFGYRCRVRVLTVGVDLMRFLGVFSIP
jgi:hypothetical protein